MAKVLCVEDVPSIAKLVFLELTERGYEVAHARNSAEAIQKALSEQPDVILLDNKLGQDADAGLTVLAQLKANPVTASVPVIMMSATIDGWRLQRTESLGAFAHLVKPLNFPELAQTIAKALNPEE
jgi:two-component system phosphate regulon response regulator PhoB